MCILPRKKEPRKAEGQCSKHGWEGKTEREDPKTQQHAKPHLPFQGFWAKGLSHVCSSSSDRETHRASSPSLLLQQRHLAPSLWRLLSPWLWGGYDNGISHSYFLILEIGTARPLSPGCTVSVPRTGSVLHVGVVTWGITFSHRPQGVNRRKISCC